MLGPWPRGARLTPSRRQGPSAETRAATYYSKTEFVFSRGESDCKPSRVLLSEVGISWSLDARLNRLKNAKLILKKEVNFYFLRIAVNLLAVQLLQNFGPSYTLGICKMIKKKKKKTILDYENHSYKV